MTNPIWIIKTRLQLNKSAIATSASRWYGSSVECARDVIHYEGIFGLYRGLSASYLGSFETVLHLVIYKQLKSRFVQALKILDSETTSLGEVKHWISTSGAAASAKLAATVITCPHEIRSTSPLIMA